MNNELTKSGLSRRSFIKRSVVATVAVSTMGIFSGLVHAQSGFSYCGASDCKPANDCEELGQGGWGYICTLNNGGALVQGLCANRNGTGVRQCKNP